MRFCAWWGCRGMPGLLSALWCVAPPHGITHPSACPCLCTCRCICANEPRKFDASKAAMLANLSELAVRQVEHRWAMDEHRKHNVGLMRQLSCYEQPFLFVDIAEPGESPWNGCTCFLSHVAAMCAGGCSSAQLDAGRLSRDQFLELRAHHSAICWLCMCCSPLRHALPARALNPFSLHALQDWQLLLCCCSRHIGNLHHPLERCSHSIRVLMLCPHPTAELCKIQQTPSPTPRH